MRYQIRALSLIVAATASVAISAQPSNQLPLRQLRANNTALAYLEQGQGAPVVFVHGAVADLRFWEPQRAEFARRHRFIAYTYRYHGTTPWTDDGKQYSAETHAADLAALIAGLKAGPVHLVGLSYGGLLAAMVAMKEPQLVRTLTLAEPALHSLLMEKPEHKPLLDEWNRGVEPMVAAMKTGDNAAATRHLSALVSGDPPEHFDKLPAPFRQVLLDNSRTLPLLFAAAPPNITCEMLRGIKVPTLLVRGHRTPRLFATVNEEAARCVAGSKLAVIQNASHAMSYDNPAEFNRVVLDFVAQSTGSSKSDK